MPRVTVAPRPKALVGLTHMYLVEKDGVQRSAVVLRRRGNEAYVHYVDSDKRLDEWRLEADLERVPIPASSSTGRRKRRRADSETSETGENRSSPDPVAELNNNASKMTEEEMDHQQITAKKNFDKVNFGHWRINTWYYSPYPIMDAELDDVPLSNATRTNMTRVATRPQHGRTSDLLAGAMGRNNIERELLWVCDKCFKYMIEGTSYELHYKGCQRRSPPGRKVYQRGAHIIWEIDGAKEKLYCQNLSLFGKLFIDIKTLFFDCDNFMFYVMTDADSQRDHVLGFFSKEKVSYDDYNLACIVTLPPYQQKGYGMLMIEFSYELSKRAGKLGTPERPLSDLGLRSYLAYWVATLVRFFRSVLSVLPSELPIVICSDNVPNADFMNSVFKSMEETAAARKKKKSSKGWDGEIDPDHHVGEKSVNPYGFDLSAFHVPRNTRIVSNPDGSATTHVMIKCTLEDISQATSLRVEDVAFAMNECGLLMRRKTVEVLGKDEVMYGVSREIVEKIAAEKRVKKMCMDVKHVLL